LIRRRQCQTDQLSQDADRAQTRALDELEFLLQSKKQRLKEIGVGTRASKKPWITSMQRAGKNKASDAFNVESASKRLLNADYSIPQQELLSSHDS